MSMKTIRKAQFNHLEALSPIQTIKIKCIKEVVFYCLIKVVQKRNPRRRRVMIEMEEMEARGGEKEIPKSRDIRRHYYEFCGLCRSKKALIASHILSEHKEELEKQKTLHGNEEKEETKSNICEECGASFSKPAHLKQHMQSHLLERPFACPVDDCHSSYRRKDHLSRHMLQHEGKLFTCPVENCNHKFAYQGNMTRHIKEFHDDEEESSSDAVGKEEYICQEIGCGKKFKFLSKLKKHEESHVKLDSVEIICGEPGCMKSFTNAECLKAHVLSCHQHIHCEICGTKQLKKNIKRHMRIHETENVSTEKIKCTFKGCLHTFTTKSNLNQHIKAVHLELLPFTCRVAGCGKKFPFKHVRDKHEKSASHVYIQGDFEELDEHFQSRPRGGRKRSYPSIETMVMRKRVVPPCRTDSVFSQGSEYLAWSLSEAMGEEQSP